MRFDWKAVLGIGITVVLLWWLFRNEDPAEIWAAVRGANLPLLAVSIAITTAGFAVRAMRWRLFLQPAQPQSPFRSRFAAVCIGFMTNNLLPARIGELTRAYSYSRMEPVPVTTVFATMVVERFMDAVAILLLLLLAVRSPAFPADALPGPVASGIQGLSVVLTILLAGSVLLVARPDRAVSVMDFVARHTMPKRFARRVVSAGESFVGGLTSLRDIRLLILSILWSLGFWAFHSLSFWVGLWAFGIDLPYTAALFMNATIAFAVAVPAAPGFVGTFQAGAWIALVDVYGVASGPALGFALGWHLGSFFPVTFIGLWYARKLDLHLRDLKAEPEEGEAAEQAGPGL